MQQITKGNTSDTIEPDTTNGSLPVEDPTAPVRLDLKSALVDYAEMTSATADGVGNLEITATVSGYLRDAKLDARAVPLGLQTVTLDDGTDIQALVIEVWQITTGSSYSVPRRYTVTTRTAVPPELIGQTTLDVVFVGYEPGNALDLNAPSPRRKIMRQVRVMLP